MKINKIKIKKYLEIFSDVSDFFSEKNYTREEVNPFAYQLFSILECKDIGNYFKYNDKVHIDCKEFGLLKYYDCVDVYLKNENLKESVYKTFSSFLWDKINYGILKKYTSGEDCHRNYNLSNIILSEEDYFKSKEYYDIFKYVNNYFKNNEPLSFLLTGREGTGKSSCCLQLFKDLKIKKVLLLEESIMSNDDRFNYFKSDFIKIIEILKPEAIILDDFQLNTFDNYLSEINYIKNNIKILAITSNLSVEDFKTNKLDRAKIRCGRIDKVFEFNDIDENVKLKFIPENLNQNIKNRLLKLNIASIKEFYKRYNILNLNGNNDKINEELEEIERRYK